jgi:glycosyltransferase involved in cell wall biosynthesis
VRVFTTSRALPWLGLRAALWRFRPDLVHAHHERSVRVATGGRPGVPVVATVHVHVSREFLGCDGLVCLTREQAAELPASYRGEVAVIGNWVLPHPRPSPARLAALRAELGVAETDYVVGSIGRLEPVKGFAGLLRAFAAALPDARLVIAGEGPERAGLEALAAGLGIQARVAFTGFRADVRDLYPLFDLFVLNSADEPYGLVILEAAEAGVKVVATATTGARAIAERHPIGLVPPDHPAALAAALRAARGQGPPPGLAGFAIEDRVDALAALYRRLLAPRQA